MKALAVTAIALCLSVCLTTGQYYRGDRCRYARRRPNGQCLLLKECPYAIRQIRRGVNPILCGFADIEPIICCPRRPSEIINEPPPNPFPPSEPYPPNPFPPSPNPYPLTETPLPSPPPIPRPSGLGLKSKLKCEEYTNTGRGELPQFQTAVVGGVEALPKEFPHMAVLGYGNESNIQWLCGGSLISELFVLTAAHCLMSQVYGQVKFVRLGDLNLQSNDDDAEPQNFIVSLIYRHPDYRPPIQYNDIGLLRLKRPVKITNYVKPACLYTEPTLPDNTAPIATGWGKLAFTGDSSDHLMKVVLAYFDIDKCRKIYANVPQRRLPNGILEKSQICAGGIDESKDTCQGDSGGPLQIKNPKNLKQFFIVGITSFGKACGVENIPGVYTRVSNYISWIEENVWPDDTNNFDNPGIIRNES